MSVDALRTRLVLLARNKLARALEDSGARLADALARGDDQCGLELILRFRLDNGAVVASLEVEERFPGRCDA